MFILFLRGECAKVQVRSLCFELVLQFIVEETKLFHESLGGKSKDDDILHDVDS